MVGKEFLERLTALAAKEGTDGDSAREVQKLIDGFAADARESIAGAGNLSDTVKAIRDHAQSRLKDLDRTQADGRELLDAYATMSPPEDGVKPSLEDWLKSEQAAEDADKPKIDRFLSFLDAPEMASIRSDILSTGEITKLEAAIANAKSEIQAGLDQLDDAAALALKQEMPSVPAETPLNLLEYLAKQEGSGDADAGAIRQLLSQSTIKADIVSGRATLSDIMSSIDQVTAQSHSKQQRDLLKAAAKRLFDSYSSRSVLRGAFDTTMRIVPRAQTWTIIFIIFLACIVILYGLMSDSTLESFAEDKIARGFITLLFAVGAISIFMVVTVAIVFDVNSNSREIYERAKTILSMLLGIFGTVLGFYFGLTDDKDAAEEFSVQQIKVAEPEESVLKVTTSVVDGTAPYQFFVHVTDEEGEPLENLVRFVRSSVEELELALDVSEHAGKKVVVFVNALDSKARTALSTSELREIAPRETAPQKTEDKQED